MDSIHTEQVEAVRNSGRPRIYRVQDVEGRGPYRPGLSKYWVDDNNIAPPPTWMEEFGDLKRDMPVGWNYGCGFEKPEQASLWFSPAEQHKLNIMGFRLVTMLADRIVARSSNQVVFARARDLRTQFVVVHWPDLPAWLANENKPNGEVG